MGLDEFMVLCREIDTEPYIAVNTGLGGWQDHAVLLAPRDLLEGQPAHVEGADEMHKVLMAMLRRCGQRSEGRLSV